MINANELRIGNWLKYRNGSFIRVESITEKSLNIIFNEGIQGGGHFDMPPYIMEDDLKDFETVPLTEEILLKCGFVKEKDWYRHNVMKKYTIESGILDNNYHIRQYISKGKSLHLSDLKYLHQLQNIYFALTGQELEINF